MSRYVWVVSCIDYMNCEDILGIFDTEEKAMEFKEYCPENKESYANINVTSWECK